MKDDGAVSSISKGKPSKKSVGHSAHEVYMSYADVFCLFGWFIVCKVLVMFAEASLGP